MVQQAFCICYLRRKKQEKRNKMAKKSIFDPFIDGLSCIIVSTGGDPYDREH